MLDSFRKRDNARDPARPTVPGAPASRLAFPAPPSRVLESTGEATRPERVAVTAGSGEHTGTTTPLHEPQPVAPSAAKNAGATARLIVGPDIKLKGAEITDCDTLIVEGEVDACMDSRVIEIAEHGIFRGKVQVDVAEVRGRFEGELTAHKQLMIRAGGRVSGKIRYGKMLIDEGGELSGDVAAGVADHSEALAPPAMATPLDHAQTRTLDALRTPREGAPAGPAPNRAPVGAEQR